MKSTIISMIIVLIVMVTVPMLFMGEGNIADKFGFGFGGGKSTDSAAKTPKNVDTVVTDKRVEIYKWVDANGIMQFSEAPPEDGSRSDKVVLSPDTNVIKAVKAPQEAEEEPAGPRVMNLSNNPYTPGGAKDLVNESLDMQKLLNERQAESDRMMDSLFKKK